MNDMLAIQLGGVLLMSWLDSPEEAADLFEDARVTYRLGDPADILDLILEWLTYRRRQWPFNPEDYAADLRSACVHYGVDPHTGRPLADFN